MMKSRIYQEVDERSRRTPFDASFWRRGRYVHSAPGSDLMDFVAEDYSCSLVVTGRIPVHFCRFQDLFEIG